MSKYIKYYDTVSGATSDMTIVSPNVTYVNGGGVNKLLMLDTGVDDDALEIVESGSDLIIQKKGPLNPKDSDGYYLIEGLSSIASGAYLYSTPEGKLTLESAGNTAIAKYTGKYFSTYQSYEFQSLDPEIYVCDKNHCPLLAALPNTEDVPSDGKYYADMIYAIEDFKTKYPLFEIVWNYKTLGTNEGDWCVQHNDIFLKTQLIASCDVMHYITRKNANIFSCAKGNIGGCVCGNLDGTLNSSTATPGGQYDLYVIPHILVRNKV